MREQICFRDFCENDVDLLMDWLERPHVKEYWQESGTREDISNKFLFGLRERGVVPLIIMVAKKPIGYIQYYEACKIGRNWWPGVQQGVFGIDQFIGEPDMIGKGIGSTAIKKMIEYLFSKDGVREVIADPDPSNARAIKAYEKVGFKKSGEIETPGGKAVLMRIERSEESQHFP